MSVSGWSSFYQATKDNPHQPLMEKAVGMVGRAGSALDLGCGAGRDTRYLLAQGWRVTAVDAEAEAIGLLARFPQKNLRAIQSAIEDFVFEPETYDLVSAQYSLPFIPESHFAAAFARIKQAIKPGGFFAGQFFGIRDEWNVPGSAMTFLTREQVDSLLADLVVREIEEEDKIGDTATMGEKHWHIFHAIAQKRGAQL